MSAYKTYKTRTKMNFKTKISLLGQGSGLERLLKTNEVYQKLEKKTKLRKTNPKHNRNPNPDPKSNPNSKS